MPSGPDAPERLNPITTYYWIVGSIDGLICIDGAYDSQPNAESFARQRFDQGRWKVFPLNTRDIKKAKAALRHQMIAMGRGFDDSGQSNQWKSGDDWNDLG